MNHLTWLVINTLLSKREYNLNSKFIRTDIHTDYTNIPNHYTPLPINQNQLRVTMAKAM